MKTVIIFPKNTISSSCEEYISQIFHQRSSKDTLVNREKESVILKSGNRQPYLFNFIPRRYKNLLTKGFNFNLPHQTTIGSEQAQNQHLKHFHQKLRRQILSLNVFLIIKKGGGGVWLNSDNMLLLIIWSEKKMKVNLAAQAITLSVADTSEFFFFFFLGGGETLVQNSSKDQLQKSNSFACLINFWKNTFLVFTIIRDSRVVRITWNYFLGQRRIRPLKAFLSVRSSCLLAT